MNDKEFDIIIKTKLEDSKYQPTEAGWNSLKANINPISKQTNSPKSAAPFLISKKIAFRAAAILLPIAILGYLYNNQAIVNTIANNKSANTHQNIKKDNPSIGAVIPYQKADAMDAQNNAITATTIPNKISNSTTIKNNYASNLVAKFIAPFRNNFSNKQKKNNTETFDNANTTPDVVVNDNRQKEERLKTEEPTINEIIKKDITNNNFVKPFYASNALPNNTHKNIRNAHKQISFNIIAGYGASKGNAAIKQAGIIVQQKLSKRFYVDASVQVSSQGGALFNNIASSEKTTTNQDVNVLSGNYATTTEITDAQKSIAINRVPINQIICNPSIGMNTSEKTYIGVGAEIARNINDQNFAQFNQNATGTNSISTGSKLGEWDGGLTAKFGYRISNKLTAEAKYRQGLLNVVENLDGNTKRTYGLLSVMYRLR
jgi:hypothetical protein